VRSPGGWLLVIANHSVSGQLCWCYRTRNAPRQKIAPSMKFSLTGSFLIGELWQRL